MIFNKKDITSWPQRPKYWLPAYNSTYHAYQIQEVYLLIHPKGNHQIQQNPPSYNILSQKKKKKSAHLFASLKTCVTRTCVRFAMRDLQSRSKGENNLLELSTLFSISTTALKTFRTHGTILLKINLKKKCVLAY